MSETYTFRVDANTFKKGVANAKSFGGVFDASSKPAARRHDASCPALMGGACECEG